MYKILIKTCSASNNIWNFYQEDGVDYVAASLEDMKPTALTLLKKYGKKNIKIIDQMSGQDMDNADVYIYDSTDNYEELSNRPYINGTEIVGQLTLEDLGIQPAGDYLNQNDLEEIENKINNIDLSAYATNARVDEVEAQIENIDLTPYATKEFVSEEISNIDIPETDLSEYATKKYVDDSVAGIDIPEVDLTDYYTKEEMDTVLEDAKEITELTDELININSLPIGLYWLTTSVKQIQYGSFKYNTAGYMNTLMIISNYRGGNRAFIYENGTLHSFDSSGNRYEKTISTIMTTHEHQTITGQKTFNVLPTTSVEPTSDTHIVNKKYVDDTIASIDVSGGENSGGLEKIYELTMSSINYNDTAVQRATTEEVQKLSELITQCYKDGIYRPTFIVYDKYNKPAFLKPNSAINDMGNMGWYLYGTYTTFSTPADLKGLQEIYSIACSVGGALVNGVYTATKAEFTSARKKYLPLDNTVEYTPTSNYHPATKKYVDDVVAGVSGGSGGEANLTNYYTKTEVDALLQALRDEFVSANNNINDKLETIIYGGE